MLKTKLYFGLLLLGTLLTISKVLAGAPPPPAPDPAPASTNSVSTTTNSFNN